MSRRDYRIRIYTPGATGLSTGSVDFTLDGSRLQNALTIRHPVVIPHEGRTESQPWEFHVTDVNSSFTGQIADSSGRMDMLGRLVLAQTNTDGAGWVNAGAGRLTDLYLDESIAAYRGVVEDERTQEGNTLLFNSSNTTRLYPGGPAVNYGWMPGGRKGVVDMLRATTNGSTEFWRVTFKNEYYPMAPGAIEAVRGDVIPNPRIVTDAGNFNHLRLKLGSSDFEVVSTADVPSTSVQGFLKPSPNILDGTAKWGKDMNPPTFWIHATSARLGNGSLGVVSFSSAFLHMYSAPPSPQTPLHIGGEAGIHPMQMLKNCYDLIYNSSDTSRIRYSTAAFSTGSTGLLGQPMPKVRFRITEPSNMRQWLEDHLYRPFMVVPTIDASGQIVPRSMKLPNSTAAISFTFTGANLRDPHPSWAHPRRDAITALNIEYEHENFNVLSEAADYMDTEIRSEEVVHDRVMQIGRRAHTLRAIGYKSSPIARDPTVADFDRYIAYIKRDYFDRFGDGPISGSLYGLSTCEGVVPGEFVKVTLNSYPNPQTLARSGTRFVQVLGRTLTPHGPEFSYLDAGPSNQALTQPSLTLSSSTADAKHSVKATIGSVTAGGGFNLEIAESNTTAAPAATSQLWQSWETTGRTSGVYLVGRRKSNTKYWVRVQNTHPGRVRSAWRNSTAGKTTQKITGPSAFAGTSVVAGSVLGTWTIGDKAYKTAIHADTSTAASLSTANEFATVEAGSNRYRWEGLTLGTKYLLGVRHKDDYGGYSTGSYASVTTSTGALTAPNMDIAILYPDPVY